MQCPRCQLEAPAGARFCPQCGTSLAGRLGLEESSRQNEPFRTQWGLGLSLLLSIGLSLVLTLALGWPVFILGAFLPLGWTLFRRRR